jgi:hypothetical protein
MIGIRERTFAPIVNGSLEDLVPRDHFYRHLEHTLDLSFVRDLVQPCYAAGGRPSVDPVVFFKRHPRDYPYWGERSRADDSRRH